MAAVVHVGGGRRVRVVRGREPEEGRSRGECERGPEGGCGVAPRRIREASRWPGDAGRQPGGVAPAHAPVRSSLPAWREEVGGWHGPAQCWSG